MLAVLTALAFASPQSVVSVHVPEPGEYEALVAGTEPAPQGDWRVLSHAAGVVTALDVGNIQSENAIHTVWVARAGGEQTVPGAYALFRLKLDCEARTAQPLFFALRAANGSNIFGSTTGNPAAPYESESGAARIAAIVCDGQGATGQGYTTHQALAASVVAN